MINRLEDDHKNARFLAEGIIEIEGINIDMRTVQTNIIFLDVSGLKVEAKLFVKKLKEHGILTLNIGKRMVRLVTHRGIMEEDVEKTLFAIEETGKDLRSLALRSSSMDRNN
jgi:threonine aldolase